MRLDERLGSTEYIFSLLCFWDLLDNCALRGFILMCVHAHLQHTCNVIHAYVLERSHAVQLGGVHFLFVGPWASSGWIPVSWTCGRCIEFECLEKEVPMFKLLMPEPIHGVSSAGSNPDLLSPRPSTPTEETTVSQKHTDRHAWHVLYCSVCVFLRVFVCLCCRS